MWGREGICPLFRSFTKLNLPLIAGSVFSFQKYLTLARYSGKGGLFVFMNFFFVT